MFANSDRFVLQWQHQKQQCQPWTTRTTWKARTTRVFWTFSSTRYCWTIIKDRLERHQSTHQRSTEFKTYLLRIIIRRILLQTDIPSCSLRQPRRSSSRSCKVRRTRRWTRHHLLVWLPHHPSTLHQFLCVVFLCLRDWYINVFQS